MLQIQEEEKQGALIYRLKGRLDAVTAPQLDVLLTEAMNEEKKFFVLDFTRVDYLSSAGMRLLLAYTKKLQVEEGAIHLFGLHKDISEIIKMGGFEQILQIFADEKQALYKD